MSDDNILSELQISKKDTYLYDKAVRVLEFMKNVYKGEDLRFVSAYLFNDSKIIDKNAKLRSLFNRFATVERPNIIYIRTDTNLKINGISIKDLTQKLHLCAFFGGDIESLVQDNCSVVISENLSFFMSAMPDNAIFLYSKGFHLINSLTAFIKKLKYNRLIHFGDVDTEGLAIFEAFKKNLPRLTFYPDMETVKFIIDKFKDSLPLNKQKANGCEFKHTREYYDLVKNGISIEQEFVHSLFYKKILKKPKWMK